MIRYTILITEPAEQDLQEISDYIAQEIREPSAAQLLIGKFSASIFNLEHLPLRNALVSDERLSVLGVRKLTIDNFIIFYMVSEADGNVTVMRILFGKRDWISLL